MLVCLPRRAGCRTMRCARLHSSIVNIRTDQCDPAAGAGCRHEPAKAKAKAKVAKPGTASFRPPLYIHRVQPSECDLKSAPSLICPSTPHSHHDPLVNPPVTLNPRCLAGMLHAERRGSACRHPRLKGSPAGIHSSLHSSRLSPLFTPPPPGHRPSALAAPIQRAGT